MNVRDWSDDDDFGSRKGRGRRKGSKQHRCSDCGARASSYDDLAFECAKRKCASLNSGD